VATQTLAPNAPSNNLTTYNPNTTANGGAAYQTSVPGATTATTGAIPQISAQQIMAPTGYGVAQNTTNYSYNPATSNTATGYNAATTGVGTTYNPAQSNLDLSSAGFTSALQSAQDPQNAKARQALQESLAANGVVGGGGVGALQQLSLQELAQFQGNEQSGLLSLDNTALAQSQGNQNADNAASQFGISEGLNQAQTNAASQNAASQFGINAGLNQSQYNAGQQNAQQQYTLSNWGQEEQANTAALNAQSQFNDTNQIGIATQNAANNLTGQEQNQSANLNAGEFNAQEANATDQFNTSNLIKAAQGNDATYNQFLAQQQANANQDWLAQLQSQTQLATNAASNQTTALNPIYTQPSSSTINFSNLGAAPTQTTTAPAQPTPVSPGSNASKSTV